LRKQPIFGCGMSIRSGSMMRHVLGTKASCSPVSSSPYQHILAISHLQPVICALHQVVLRLLNQTALPRLKQFFSGGKSVQHQTPPCYYSSMYLDAGKGWKLSPIAYLTRTMQLASKQDAIWGLGLILMDVFCHFHVVLSTYMYSSATHTLLTFTFVTNSINFH